MREIKFRGKAWFGGEWHYGLLAKGTGDYTYIKSGHVGVRVDPDTVGQFTGLRDKDGNEIYEGDIVKIYCPDGFANYEVVWDSYDARWYGRCIHGAIGVFPWAVAHQLVCSQTIGTIYDTPEPINQNQ